jgi:hypothetical protein
VYVIPPRCFKIESDSAGGFEIRSSIPSPPPVGCSWTWIRTFDIDANDQGVDRIRQLDLPRDGGVAAGDDNTKRSEKIGVQGSRRGA